MLPTKSEIKMMEKSKFDLYTITNLSFMDLAYSLGLKVNLNAVCVKDLADRSEEVPSFSNFATFLSGEPHVQVKKLL
jgi:hypothetical protein